MVMYSAETRVCQQSPAMRTVLPGLLLVTEPLTQPKASFPTFSAFPSTSNSVIIDGELVYLTIVPKCDDLTDVWSKLSSSDQEFELLLPYWPLRLTIGLGCGFFAACQAQRT